MDDEDCLDHKDRLIEKQEKLLSDLSQVTQDEEKRQLIQGYLDDVTHRLDPVVCPNFSEGQLAYSSVIYDDD